MRIYEVMEIIDAEVLTGKEFMDLDVKAGCGSDLMSDVLSFTRPGTLLLTGLTNPQVIYTADAADIKAVCFVRGKKPGRETVRLAKGKKMVLLATRFSMFSGCGRLYKEGLKGCGND